MDWLWKLLHQMTIGVGRAILALGRALIHHIHLGIAAIVAAVVILKDLLLWVLGMIVDLVVSIGELVGLIDEAAGMVNQGAFDSGVAGFVNAIFPLEECILFLVILAAIYMIASTIRIVKGWVPSMN